MVEADVVDVEPDHEIVRSGLEAEVPLVAKLCLRVAYANIIGAVDLAGRAATIAVGAVTRGSDVAIALHVNEGAPGRQPVRDVVETERI